MSYTNMKFKIALWIASIFICLICSSANRDCNEFADSVLNQMKEEKSFFQEPYEIPDGQRSFAIYDLEFGHVYGLSTLHRTDDVLPQKKGSRGDRFIKVFLGAGKISMKSSIKRKFLNLGRSANLEADVPFVSMELDVVPKFDGSEPEIQNFKVDEVKGLTMKFSGTGIIKDFVLNAFTSAFGRFFKGMVKNGIEEKLRSFLKDKMKEIPIPAECLNAA